MKCQAKLTLDERYSKEILSPTCHYSDNASDKDRGSLVDLVSVYYRYFGMKFGLKKCGVLVIRRGVKERNDGVEFSNGEMVKEVDVSGYKYF